MRVCTHYAYTYTDTPLSNRDDGILCILCFLRGDGAVTSSEMNTNSVSSIAVSFESFLVEIHQKFRRHNKKIHKSRSCEDFACGKVLKVRAGLGSRDVNEIA